MAPSAAAASPLVIPLFLAHQGCPHRCVFCNQYSITGQAGGAQLAAGVVAETIDTWLARPRRLADRPVQVAFYGGSFTGLAPDTQAELLQAVAPYLVRGEVATIRLSTRPDYVTAATVAFLRDHGVGVVELGVQSLDEAVLAASRRGHGVEAVARAFRELKAGGFAVGGQLMVGLPGDSARSALASARALAALGPDFVRIYPALVIRGSELARSYAAGGYRPLTLARAVALTARLKAVFDRHHIPVVRMGLQAADSLARDLVAGPFHPAFGELVLSRLLFRQARRLLAALPAGAPRVLVASPADQSILRGPGNASLARLAALGLADGLELSFDPAQPRHTLRLATAP